MVKKVQNTVPKVRSTPKERQEHWEDAIRVLEQRSNTDLSFLDELDDATFKDQVLQLPYEDPRDH